jgi:hypothetical protein
MREGKQVVVEGRTFLAGSGWGGFFIGEELLAPKGRVFYLVSSHDKYTTSPVSQLVEF